MNATRLNEEDIPPELLPQVRKWWDRQMEKIAKEHGSSWPEHKEWIEDYLNAEIRERLTRRKDRND